MIGSAVLAFLTSFFMPLGRFILFKIGELFGISSFADVDRKQLGKSSSISFTEAKILETKAWKLLESEDWDEVVLTARKVQSNLDKQTFPKLWKTMILALIAREDYIEAQKALGEFLQVFTNNALKESGQLLEAYLKSCLGDYPSALKIIRSFSEDRVKSFAADETALSLLILGRCDLAYKDNVQAHIDLNKSFAIAQLSFLKAEALVEIIELDFKMNSKEMIGKLKAKIVDINGGKKSQSLVKTIQSIVAMSEGNKPKALELALAACEIAVRNSRACAWYGHLLCLEGRQNEAEQLLDKMTPESVDATRLMTEVTSSTA
jgi:tetratricopeptide (TPR) repeat protein